MQIYLLKIFEKVSIFEKTCDFTNKKAQKRIQ